MVLRRFLKFLRKKDFKGLWTNGLSVLWVARKGRYPVRSIKVNFKIDGQRSDVRGDGLVSTKFSA